LASSTSADSISRTFPALAYRSVYHDSLTSTYATPTLALALLVLVGGCRLHAVVSSCSSRWRAWVQMACVIKSHHRPTTSRRRPPCHRFGAGRSSPHTPLLTPQPLQPRRKMRCDMQVMWPQLRRLWQIVQFIAYLPMFSTGQRRALRNDAFSRALFTC
jgi:hypothetical protein